MRPRLGGIHSTDTNLIVQWRLIVQINYSVICDRDCAWQQLCYWLTQICVEHNNQSP